MSHQPISKLWLLGPPLSILVAVFAYYLVVPSFRGWVDARVPWVAENIGSRLRAEKQDDAAPRETVAVAPAPEPVPAQVAVAPPTPPPPPPKPVYVAPDGVVDLAKLSANRADWPKSLVLKTPKEFPAVVDGKAVGKVVVPAGSEVNLLKIEQNQLGVEYRGGGAWIGEGETDLADRLRSGAP